ncbi:MAG: beta-lactamase family protein [Acidimicrobiia bacterium]|nr:beta-lactamase family protein [Acidimicrobiia bacterium]
MTTLIGVATLAAACSSGTGDAASSDDTSSGDAPSEKSVETAAVYPDPDWNEITPEEAGVDPVVLQEMADLAQAGGSNCLVVTRNGELVGEYYWNGTDATTPRELFSATKSITSALVGIASDRGELDIDEPASKYITEWQGTDSEDVTIRNLLSNDSGREWDFITDYVEMGIQAPDKTRFSTDLGQQFEPGTEWEYNNAAIQTLDAVLEEATGMDPGDYADRYLFEPTGMEATYGHDPAGNANMFFNVQASCRDLARFGYLWLRDGEWADDEQVVSADYVEESITPTELNSAYGFLFWLNRPGHWVKPSTLAGKPEGEGVPIEGVPEDAFFAEGLGGQVSVVYPSTGIVFTRMAPGDLEKAANARDADVVPELQRLAAQLVPDEG